MPTTPTVSPPSSRPTSSPSSPTMGTRRSICSSAPITNSASAAALALAGRHDLDAGACAGLDVDVLGARRQPTHDAQLRRALQRRGVQRDRGRDDDRAHAVQGVAEDMGLLGQLGRVANGVARSEPGQHVRIQRFDDQHVHHGNHDCVTGPA